MDFLLSPAQVELRDAIKNFASRELNLSVSENDAAARFPWEEWRKCAEMGIMGLAIPKDYGGLGADMLTTALCLEMLGYACRDSGLVHAVIAHVLSSLQVLAFGSEEQKNRYLSRASKGELVFAQAITEANSGSDALSMKTAAAKCAGGYRVNGSKMFVSNGPVCDVALVFAVTDPAKKKMGSISCFILEKEDAGFARNKALDKLGLRTLQNGELVFIDCMLPLNRILGREGQGAVIFSMGMQTERTLLFACHLGIMQRNLEQCLEYTRTRDQGGQTINRYQLIMDKIARMAVNIELGRLILYKAAWLLDQKKQSTLEASIAKLFISESLQKTCLDAVQIHGAYGYMKDFGIERDLRDSIASTIYSGTSEIQKILISTLCAS